MASAVMSNLVRSIRENYRERKSLCPVIAKEFIVELSFLSKYFSSDCLRTTYTDTGEINVSAYGREAKYTCEGIVITGDDTVNGPTGETLTFYYFGSQGFYAGANYGLIILDKDDNVLYWREPGQDPRTEWLINSLAGDLEDENGDPIFDGEPVTF